VNKIFEKIKSLNYFNCLTLLNFANNLNKALHEPIPSFTGVVGLILAEIQIKNMGRVDQSTMVTMHYYCKVIKGRKRRIV